MELRGRQKEETSPWALPPEAPCSVGASGLRPPGPDPLQEPLGQVQGPARLPAPPSGPVQSRGPLSRLRFPCL